MKRFFQVEMLVAFMFVFPLSSRATAAMEKRIARAVPAHIPPVIDGRLQDPAWADAPWHGDFVQRRPVNGASATFDTRFAVTFDEAHIYIAVRCFIDTPDNVVTRLTRRDRFADYDFVTVLLSPRNDGLTGYEFTVNPDGVKRDTALYDDDTHDVNWDAVWHAETAVRDREWTVEIAIPLDQLRFSEGNDTWGFQVNRWVAHLQEGVAFNPVPVDKSGKVSPAGKLTGVQGIAPEQPAAITPETYFLYRSTTTDFDGRGKDGFQYGAGGYGRFGLGSDTVLNVAVTPDFGQVEVDQVVLNLSTIETLFPEKRPFFLEGGGLFRTPIQLFYSRRIGAPPPTPSLDDDQVVVTGPTATPILAAAKFTGRTQSGFSMGAIQAVLAPTEFIIENEGTPGGDIVSGSPWTSATVLRLNTEPTKTATIGAIATAFNPGGSSGSYSGGVDVTAFDANREYVFQGQVVGSLRYDGVFEQEEARGVGIHAKLGREGGEHFRFSMNYQYFSEDFDPNDLGYLRRNDLHHYLLFLRLQKMEKWGPFSEVHVTATPNGHFNNNGLNLGQGGGIGFFGKWLTDWVTDMGIFSVIGHYDDREARGGPPIEMPGFAGGWLWVRSPQRTLFGGDIGLEAHSTPFAYSLEAWISLQLRLSRLELALIPKLKHKLGEQAYVDTVDSDDVEEITIIGRRDLDAFELGLKGTFLIARDISVQLFSQFLSVRADYSDYRQLLSDSSTSPYDYPDASADFSRIDLVIQALLRWEYAPGSTLYAVYTHFGYTEPSLTDPGLLTNLRYLKDEAREHLLMVKLSHRFGL
ncbi:MAG: DUF5916 domain-containing protein [Myxococcota bacterium]|nr:DUF5916 domain-containing protein [Myxococcota bacterium]